MLFRFGRIGYFLIFAVLLFVWTSVHDRSRQAVQRSWQVTTHAFGQGASFASDVEVVEPEMPSPYAYVFYATRDTYACSVLVNVQRIREIYRTKHRIFVLITSTISQEYIEAISRLDVTVSTQTPPALAEGSVGAGYYQDCLLKLYGFRMHQIDPTLQRVIVLDSDQLILKNLDYLFDSQIGTDLAAPRAYWIAKEAFSTAFMMITLSERLWRNVEIAIEEIKEDKYDMDVINDLLGDTVLMLPGHFVTLNSHWEDWNLPKWFHEPEVVVAGITNGTHDLPLAKDLTKREEGKLDAFEASSYEGIPVGGDSAESADLKSKELASKMSDDDLPKTSDDKMPTLPKLSDDDLPTTPIMSDDIASIPDTINPSKHSDAASHLPNDIIPPHDPSIPFPTIDVEKLKTRRYYNELFALYNQTSVLHFTAMAKPWSVDAYRIAKERPEAHPVFGEQFMLWRKTAIEICPSKIVEVL